MTYTVKELFLTLQGEGARSGGERFFVAFLVVICGVA